MAEAENKLTINDNHLSVGHQVRIVTVGQEFRLFWVEMATAMRDTFEKSLLAKEELKVKFSIPEDGLHDIEGALVETKHDLDGLGWWAKVEVKQATGQQEQQQPDQQEQP